MTGDPPQFHFWPDICRRVERYGMTCEQFADEGQAAELETLREHERRLRALAAAGEPADTAAHDALLRRTPYTDAALPLRRRQIVGDAGLIEQSTQSGPAALF